MPATEEIVEEQFTVGEECELSVSNVSGRIAVRAGDAGIIQMRAVKRGREEKVANTDIETTQEGNRVRVRTRALEEGMFGLNRGVCSVDYTFTVPLGCAVECKAVSADVSLLGTGGSLQLSTVSGDAEIEDITGSCSINTVSGDVQASRVAAPATLRTTSGDISVRESNLPSLNAHTVSGDISVHTPLAADAQYYTKTVSGNLTLVVPGDAAATVEMRTVSGRVHSDIPAEIINSGRRHWQGRINGGGAHVEMNSVSGNLRIQASSAVPSTRSREEHDAAVSEALTLLERGEISVEEAMRRIKGEAASV
jgi:hypothetical protein